jgi:hypothetical protein
MVRKVCLNCRCGKAEHNVVEEEDPGFFFVGKLFDRYIKIQERKREKEIFMKYIRKKCTSIFQDSYLDGTLFEIRWKCALLT